MSKVKDLYSGYQDMLSILDKKVSKDATKVISKDTLSRNQPTIKDTIPNKIIQNPLFDSDRVTLGQYDISTKFDRRRARGQVRSILKGMSYDNKKYYSEDAVNLLLQTAAHESHFGYYDKQLRGEALGAFQIEKNTYEDIKKSKSKYIPVLKNSKFEDLKNNFVLSTIIARLKYYHAKDSIPNNIEDNAKYWKTYYNTKYGKGKEEDFIKNVNKYKKDIYNE